MRPTDKVMEKAALFLYNCITKGALSPLYASPVPASGAPEPVPAGDMERAVEAAYRDPDFIGNRPVLCRHGWIDPNNLCPQCECGDEATLAHPAKPAVREGWIAAALRKIDEAKKQLDINVEIAERDHPEGPIVDGKRVRGMVHSQAILAGHVRDRLNELAALLPASPAPQEPASPSDEVQP